MHVDVSSVTTNIVSVGTPFQTFWKNLMFPNTMWHLCFWSCCFGNVPKVNTCLWRVPNTHHLSHYMAIDVCCEKLYMGKCRNIFRGKVFD